MGVQDSWLDSATSLVLEGGRQRLGSLQRSAQVPPQNRKIAAATIKADQNFTAVPKLPAAFLVARGLGNK